MKLRRRDWEEAQKFILLQWRIQEDNQKLKEEDEQYENN